MKKCNKCLVEKSVEFYGKDKRNKDGLQGICEACRKEAKQKSRSNRQIGINVVYVKDKTCNKCEVTKPIEEFFKDPGISDGHATICKSCKTESSMQWRAANRERYNANQRAQHKKNYLRNRLYRYKITPEEYNSMLAEQNGVCKLCKNPPKGERPLVVDHCHDSGAVRGLLCYGCNRLMVLADNAELLNAALAYKSACLSL